jgi:recombinational DNA repair protein (RecF pathway)
MLMIGILVLFKCCVSCKQQHAVWMAATALPSIACRQQASRTQWQQLQNLVHMQTT